MKTRKVTRIPTRRISLAFVLALFAAVLVGVPLLNGVSAISNSAVITSTDKRDFAKTKTRIAPNELRSPNHLFRSLTNDAIDPQRAARLKKLADERRAGSPFAIQEIEILDAFEANLPIDSLEADVVISRALYDVFVAGKTATKEQRDLLDVFLPYNRAHAQEVVARNALLNSDTPQALGISAPDNSREWELYIEPELFNQLSSAYQQRLERTYGKKGRAVRGSSFKGSSAMIPEVSPTNSLVNNFIADTTAQDTQSETFILLGAGNTIISSFNDSGSNVGGANHFTGTARSTDLGNSWLDQGILPASAAGDAGDPVMARNNTTGLIILGTLGFSSSSTLQTFRSTNDGVSYLAPVDADGGGTSDDKEWLACDNNGGAGQGNFYMFYRDFGAGGGMSFTRSTDGGATWSARQLLAVNLGQGAAVTVDANHTVYAFWLTSPNTLVLRRSTDFGVTFGPQTTVAVLRTTGINGDFGLGGGFRTNAFMQVVPNPTDPNQLYAVWPDKGIPPSTDKANIYFSKTTDGGSTWAAPVQVNTDAGTNDQWQPSIAITPDGTGLFVSWYDRRLSPTNNRIDVFGRNATISGTTVTFGPDYRITDGDFPVIIGQDPSVNSVYMGDYDNATADNTNFYRTWGDNRLLLGGHANQPDVRFATIPKAGPGPIPFAQSQSLISESCIPNNNAIDPGEVVTVSLSVTNLGTAATTNAVGTLLSGGGVKFPSGPVNYGVIPPGGTVSRSYTFTAMDPDLFCGGTVQARLQLQDGATNLGTLTYRFTTGTTTTQTFSNPASITINDNAAATPYPSNITVSGISNFVGVTVTLNGLSHTFPADIDIILVSPSGQAAYVMSDVGGNTPVTNLTLTFDDNAAAALGSGALSSGTFRPSNIDTTTDNMPPPAPAPPYAAAFSTFNGFTANGTWSLYVRDDAGADVGSIANGWSLGILVPTCAPCGPTAAPASISGNIVSNDGAPLSGVTLRLTGSGGVEQTLTDSQGNYRFADVETGLLYTVTPSLANYMFAPGQRSFSLLADRSDAVFTAFPVQPNSNPLDIAEFFVRQQYLDFLGREPDQAGLDYWSSQLRSCGANLSCLNSRRIGVSAAFFVEAEFQQTGSFIFQMYKAGLGRELHYQEYVADRAQLIVGPDLNIRRQAFADAFVTRPEFIQRYQASTTAASFTDALLANIVSAGVDLSSQRTNLIARYNLGGSVNESRSLALQTATENAALGQAVYNRAFVLMEYFGYLRRDPDQGGFDFWVNVLNNRQPGNYRGMVCAFLTSVEYQRRFSPAITRSDADCAER